MVSVFRDNNRLQLTPLKTFSIEVAIFVAVGIYAALTAITSLNTASAYRLWGYITLPSCIVAIAYLTTLYYLSRHHSHHHFPALAPTHSPARTPVRARILAAFLLITSLAPMYWGVAHRAHTAAPPEHEIGANLETYVVERSGQLLLHTGTPYIDAGHLATPHVADYNPYSPLLAIFGFPTSWWGTHWWTDVRLYLLPATVLVLLLTWLLAHKPAIPESALLLLVAVPPVTMNFVAAGIDALLVALLLLCAVAAFHDKPATAALAGLAGGIALGMKLTALPVVLVVLIALAYQWGAARRPHTAHPAAHPAARSAERSAERSAAHPAAQFAVFTVVLLAVTLAAYIPFYLKNPDAMVENIIHYPSGSAAVTSSAQGGTPGQLIAATGPVGVWIARALLFLAGIALVVWMVKRPPSTLVRTLWICAVGLTAAMLLMPASRFGYLIYPAVLAAGALVARDAQEGTRDAQEGIRDMQKGNSCGKNCHE